MESQGISYQTMPGGYGGGGDGFGGGMGGLLVGALLGRGLLGNNDRDGRGYGADGGFVTPALLSSSLAGVTDCSNNTAVLTKLGSIEAAIPYNEAQVQLALAGAQASIVGAVSSTSDKLGTQATSNFNSIVNANAMLNQNISAVGTANMIATKDAASAAALASKGIENSILTSMYETAKNIKADGDLTRGLIISQNETTLNRLLTTAQNEIIELRGDARVDRRGRETEVNVTQTVNQSQAQAQAQTQFQVLANLAAEVRNLAGDVQSVRQGQVIFNSGRMTDSGTQAAANTKVA